MTKKDSANGSFFGNAADRQAILKALEDKLKRGAKSMVGNRGYRRFLKVERGAVSLDAAVDLPVSTHGFLKLAVSALGVTDFTLD